MEKKNIAFIIIIICILVSAFALYAIHEVYPISDLRGKGTDKLTNPGNISLIIQKRKDCIPVSLYLYDDNTYELFTEYYSCKPFEFCTLQLKYTKSIKGTYNFDLTKILNDNIEIEDTISDNKTVDYEISSFPSMGEEYKNDYVVKKGQNNISLNELLKELNIDLNKCAIPDYN